MQTRTCPACGLEDQDKKIEEHATRAHDRDIDDLEEQARAPRPDQATKLAAHLRDRHGYTIIDLGRPGHDDATGDHLGTEADIRRGRRPAMRPGGYL